MIFFNKTTQTLVSLLLIVISHSCKAQIQVKQLPNSYSTQIIGVWISDDDPTYKIEFTSSGFQKEYINNQLQQEVYHYILTTSCSGNTSNIDSIYLKRYTDLNDITCDIFNGIYTDSSGEMTLSIRTERGKLELYTKQ